MIKKPKARPAGKTPYASDTIHPNTFLFLHELKGNNNREWLKSRSYRWSGRFFARFPLAIPSIVSRLCAGGGCLMCPPVNDDHSQMCMCCSDIDRGLLCRDNFTGREYWSTLTLS